MYLVCLVSLVHLVYLVSFFRPNKRDRPNEQDRQPKMLADDAASLLVAPNPGYDEADDGGQEGNGDDWNDNG